MAPTAWNFKELKNVFVDGFPSYTHIGSTKQMLSTDYMLRTCAEAPHLADYGPLLRRAIRAAGREQDVVIFNRPLHVALTDSAGTKITIDFKPGFVTDFASVPPIGRIFIPNHGSKLVIPSVIHDLFTSLKYLGFERNNELLREIAIVFGNRRSRARFVKWCVSTIIGRSYYEKSGQDRFRWNALTVDASIKGKHDQPNA